MLLSENPVQDCAGKDLRDLLDDFNFNLDNLGRHQQKKIKHNFSLIM